jgi:hypothetical protein
MPRLQSQSLKSFQRNPGELQENILYRELDPDEYFVNNFASGYPTLAERYTKRSKELHVHLSFCGREYCAVFYRPLVNEALGKERIIDIECCKVYGCSDQVEMPVLLNVSERVQQSKKMLRVHSIPSVVRLKLLNLCPHRFGHTSNGLLNSVRCERLGLLTNRESRSVVGFPFVGEYEIPSQMVENSTKIIQSVTEPERKLLGRRVRLTADAPRMLQAFTLEIVNNYTWLRRAEFADGETKGVHVLVRPYCLGLKAA